MKIQFYEVQRYRQWWLMTLLLIVSAIPIYAIIQHFSLGITKENSNSELPELITTLCLTIGVFALFWFIKLKTNINADGIEMDYFPFSKKNIKWSDIKEAKVVDYGFVGGWGVRFFTRYGTVYNVAGRHGLAIKLKSGKKFLIGTQRPEELKEKLKQANQTNS